MKTRMLLKLLVLPALAAVLGLVLPARVAAQSFTILHSFTALNYDSAFNYYYNSDGANPCAALILSSNTLYGTASHGGTNNSNAGVVFAVNTDGTGFRNLHSFSGLWGFDTDHFTTNTDGALPTAGLVLSGGTLYGTTENGGTNSVGTVFAVNTDGTGFRCLHSFTDDSDGALPTAGLVLSSNSLYGTTYEGGISDSGTVFKMNTDGTGFTNLHRFNGLPDGYKPTAGLIVSGNTLYGTTFAGGSNNMGMVFAINTDGTSYTSLYSFSAGTFLGGTIPNHEDITNSDGARPSGPLILSGNTLYGTAVIGGVGGAGTVFALNIDGSGFTNLYTFTTPTPNYNHVNADGACPYDGLVLSGNTLYGTTEDGGTNGIGTVFAVSTNGTGLTILKYFDYNYVESSFGGDEPQAGLVLSSNTLYGTTYYGGTNSNGIVFSLSLRATNPLPPKLTIIRSGTNVVLAWPTNATGFTLQFTTNLASPAAWNMASPVPVVVNTNNVVTNTISSARRFFRLSQ